MTIQGLYCYLDMGNNTIMYYKCSHVPNLYIDWWNELVVFFGLHGLDDEVRCGLLIL